MDHDINTIYNKLLHYAKKLIDRKSYCFNEYDLVNESFVIDGSFSDKTIDTITMVFYKERGALTANDLKPTTVKKCDTYTCAGCNEILPISSFVFRKSYLYQYLYNTGVCLECERKRCREWAKKRRIMNPELVRNLARQKYHKNIDKYRSDLRNRHKTQAHKDYMKMWREKNKDRLKIYATTYHLTIAKPKRQLKSKQRKIAA